jgi:hypothetical protein
MKFIRRSDNFDLVINSLIGQMKNRHILLTMLFTILLVKAIHAQALTSPSSGHGTISRFVHHDKVAFKLDYFGELGLHPGLTLGTDYSLVRNKHLTIHWDVDLGGYWHRWNHTALFLKSSLGSRFAAGPVFADINAGIGYLHDFAAGTIYESDLNGGVVEASNRGRAHFMPNASLLFGWDSTRKGKQFWAVHFGPEVYLQSHVNHIFLPHVAVKVGLTYKFKQL